VALRLRISDLEAPSGADPMSEPTLQRRIWAAHISRGFSRHKFARSLGVHGSSVVTWCTGERDPDLRQLIAVALLLDYPLEQLIFGREGQAGARAVVEGRVPPSDHTLRAVVRSYVVLVGCSTVYGSAQVPARLEHLAAERWTGGDDADDAKGLGKLPLDVALAQSLLALRRGPDLEIPKHGPGRETAQRALRGWAALAAHGQLREQLERGVRDDAALAQRVGRRLIELATDDEADAWSECVREVVDELTGAAERRRVLAALDLAAELSDETGAATADDDDDDERADELDAAAAALNAAADELEHDAQRLVRWRPSPGASQRRPAAPAAPEPAVVVSQRRPAAPAAPAAPEPAAPDSSQPDGLGRAQAAYARMMDASRAAGGRSLSDDEIDALIAREVSQVSRSRGAAKVPPAAAPTSDKPDPTRRSTPGSRTRR
jgi:transcriptional regulator with XRE-family HTH domain